MAETIHGYLGIGSNLGDRLANLQLAVDRLASTPRLSVLEASRVYESPAWGYDSARAYLNAVLEIRWAGPPLSLADQCYRIEAAGGRHLSSSSHEDGYSDRTVDLDLLWLEGVETDSPRLSLPHPRAHLRAFVLKPWIELAAELMLQPTPNDESRTLTEWLNLLSENTDAAAEVTATTAMDDALLTIEQAN